MNLFDILQAKPVLIGLHLGSAIVGIDAFLWLLGKLKDTRSTRLARIYPALIGTGAFVASWLYGGYYYIVHYGKVVKPIIKAGSAPWAHSIVMEVKEHIFLFIVPLALTVLFITLLNQSDANKFKLDDSTIRLTALIAGLGLAIGAMGFIISSAARWAAS